MRIASLRIVFERQSTDGPDTPEEVAMTYHGHVRQWAIEGPLYQNQIVMISALNALIKEHSGGK